MGIAIIVKGANYANDNIGKVTFVREDTWKNIEYSSGVAVAWANSQGTARSGDGSQVAFATEGKSKLRFAGGSIATAITFYNATASTIAAITNGTSITSRIVKTSVSDTYGRNVVPANEVVELDIPQGAVSFGVRLSNSSAQDLKPAKSQYM